MAKKTSREKLNKLVKKRKKLKERKEEGKVTFLGNIRRKRIQDKINKNPSAQEDLAASKRKKKITLEKEGRRLTKNDGQTGKLKKVRTTLMRVKKNG